MNSFEMGGGLGGMGILGVILMIFGAIWSVLMFFAPFFWYGAWYRAKQIDAKLSETNELLRDIELSLAEPRRPKGSE